MLIFWCNKSAANFRNAPWSNTLNLVPLKLTLRNPWSQTLFTNSQNIVQLHAIRNYGFIP